jgi:hypothetical protein
MPTKPMSQEQMQEALDLEEEYGSAYAAWKAGATTVAHTTIQGRAIKARVMGLRPTTRKDAPRVYTRERLGRMHLIIPDCQVKPGVDIDHLRWVGEYIAEKRPDVIICIGDFADIESLSRYDMGTMRGENKRLVKDLQIARTAMDILTRPFRDLEGYKPEMHLTNGNHEDRLDRFANEHPYLEEVVGTHMLNYEEFGWVVHPFLKVVEIDGCCYSHYFISGNKGLAVSSANAMKSKRSKTSIMGHNQSTDVAFDPLSHQWFIFCGLCCTHDERYLGPQGNNHRRQILVLHEVEEGRCDPMFVSLKFLKKQYG